MRFDCKNYAPITDGRLV